MKKIHWIVLEQEAQGPGAQLTVEQTGEETGFWNQFTSCSMAIHFCHSCILNCTSDGMIQQTWLSIEALNVCWWYLTENFSSGIALLGICANVKGRMWKYLNEMVHGPCAHRYGVRWVATSVPYSTLQNIVMLCWMRAKDKRQFFWGCFYDWLRSGWRVNTGDAYVYFVLCKMWIRSGL
jgi:hypothetical protein